MSESDLNGSGQEPGETLDSGPVLPIGASFGKAGGFHSLSRSETHHDTRVDESELKEALEVAYLACDRARREILPRFRQVAVETKGDGSPVTEADREAERVIRKTIGEHFPDDAILGEEFGVTESKPNQSQRRRWVVDPIDGTIAFAKGIPLFTTLVALLIDEVPVVGVIDLPAVNDRIGGYKGGGVWRGEERLSVTNPKSRAHASAGDILHDALVCHGDVYCFEAAGLRPLYDGLSHTVQKFRGYTDAFGHLLVLSGAADAMVDCDLNPWDAAVTQVLATEAGGACWAREREGGDKIDLIFGSAEIVQAIGEIGASRDS